MNNLQFSEAIKSECKKQHIKIGDLLENCGLNKGFISDLSRKNKTPSIDNALKIADYLQVSIDYLLGRSEQPTQTINNQASNKGIQAQNYNASAPQITGIENEVLNEMKKMNNKEKAQLLLKACEMTEKEV